MNKNQALRQVAVHVAGNLMAGQLVEASGLEEYEVTDADHDRLTWAIDEVAQRLYRMGDKTWGPDSYQRIEHNGEDH